MKYIKNFEDQTGSFTNVDLNAKESYFSVEKYSKSLPFNFKSPISNKTYEINRGRVRLSGKIYNITLYVAALTSPIDLYINDINSNDDILKIHENNEEKSIYIKNLEEKDIIYQIINDVKNKIKK